MDNLHHCFKRQKRQPVYSFLQYFGNMMMGGMYKKKYATTAGRTGFCVMQVELVRTIKNTCAASEQCLLVQRKKNGVSCGSCPE